MQYRWKVGFGGLIHDIFPALAMAFNLTHDSLFLALHNLGPSTYGDLNVPTDLVERWTGRHKAYI